MSNGGSILDSIQGLFSSSGGGNRDARRGAVDPVRDRLERVEQIASGVEMASNALDDEMKELRRESQEAAEAALQSARARVPEEDAGDATREDTSSRELLEDLSRCVDALEELHYRLLEIDVHPEVQSDEEREQAADRAREALRRTREAADSLAETAGA